MDRAAVSTQRTLAPGRFLVATFAFAFSVVFVEHAAIQNRERRGQWWRNDIGRMAAHRHAATRSGRGLRGKFRRSFAFDLAICYALNWRGLPAWRDNPLLGGNGWRRRTVAVATLLLAVPAA